MDQPRAARRRSGIVPWNGEASLRKTGRGIKTPDLHLGDQGKLLSRIIKDVEELENLYLRISSPIAVAAVVTFLTSLIFYAFYPMLALVALAFLVATGVGVPLLVARLARGLGRQQLELRAELNARATSGARSPSSTAGSGGCSGGWRSSRGFRTY